MNILELPKKDEAEVVPFKQIETAESLDNIFADIANEANMTIGEAKRKIEIHGSSPILAIKNFLLGNLPSSKSWKSFRKFLKILKIFTFLGIVHCHYENESGHRTYLNYFFKCDPSSFEIIDSAKKHLPLTSEIDAKFAELNKVNFVFD